jgi:hypothetical protein
MRYLSSIYFVKHLYVFRHIIAHQQEVPFRPAQHKSTKKYFTYQLCVCVCVSVYIYIYSAFFFNVQGYSQFDSRKSQFYSSNRKK